MSTPVDIIDIGHTTKNQRVKLLVLMHIKASSPLLDQPQKRHYNHPF